MLSLRWVQLLFIILLEVKWKVYGDSTVYRNCDTSNPCPELCTEAENNEEACVSHPKDRSIHYTEKICQVKCNNEEIVHKGKCTPEEEKAEARWELAEKLFKEIDDCINKCGRKLPYSPLCVHNTKAVKGMCLYSTTSGHECHAKCNEVVIAHQGECTKEELDKAQQ